MSNLQSIQVGEFVFYSNRNKKFGSALAPDVSNIIFQVVKTTAKQAVARGQTYSNLEIRFRLEDGRVLGQSYTSVQKADQQVLDEHAKEVEECDRWYAALKRIDGLEGKRIWQMSIDLEQLEALADAWDRIKNMKGGAS